MSVPFRTVPFWPRTPMAGYCYQMHVEDCSVQCVCVCVCVCAVDDIACIQASL